MTKDIEKKKYCLIEEIVKLESELEIDGVTDSDNEIKFNQTRKTISVEELKQEQQFKSFDRAKFDSLVKELNIEESYEDF